MVTSLSPAGIKSCLEKLSAWSNTTSPLSRGIFGRRGATAFAEAVPAAGLLSTDVRKAGVLASVVPAACVLATDGPATGAFATEALVASILATGALAPGILAAEEPTIGGSETPVFAITPFCDFPFDFAATNASNDSNFNAGTGAGRDADTVNGTGADTDRGCVTGA